MSATVEGTTSTADLESLLVAQAEADQPRAEPYRQLGKRAFDIVAAAFLLTLLCPVLALIALAIKLDSAGPVLYRVRRVGYHGQPLPMLKFRKMHDGATGGPLTAHGDSRLTRVGGVLTRARFDELPQLWDVLRGRMSLIGPRPEDPAFVALHAPDYEQILQVRPGITGLAQIAYRDESRIVNAGNPIDDYIVRIMPQKLTLDRLYAAGCCLRLDLWVLAWTFVTLGLRHPVSVNRMTGAMKIRRRPKSAVQSNAGQGKSTSSASATAISAETDPTQHRVGSRA